MTASGVIGRARTALRVGGLIIAAALLATACGAGDERPPTLRVLTHQDFELPEAALEEFTTRTGVEVVVFREPDQTAMVDLLARTTEIPVADVVMGFDTLELSRVIDDRLVEPYTPVESAFIDPSMIVDGNWATPVSYLDACLNRSISEYLPPERAVTELPDPDDVPKAPPTGIASLLDPAHSAEVVLPDATTSRMGVYFLLMFAERYPELGDADTPDDDYQAWPQLVPTMLQQGVALTASWESAYFEHFVRDASVDDLNLDAEVLVPTDSAAEESEIGLRPVTWGSAGMPAVTVRFRPELPEEIDIEVVGQDCIRIVNYAGIIAGTPDRRSATRFLDLVAEPIFQFNVPDRFGSRPVRTDLVRTDDWRAFGVTVDPFIPNPDRVGAEWRQLQLTWTQVVTGFFDDPDPFPEDIELTIDE